MATTERDRRVTPFPVEAQGRRRLGEVLVAAKVLPEPALAEALACQPGTGKRLGELLVDMGILDDHAVVAGLAAQLGLPVADLRHHRPDSDVVALLPEDVARSLPAVPVRALPEALEVAVADPLDGPALLRLAEAAGRPLRLVLAPEQDIRDALDGVAPADPDPPRVEPALADSPPETPSAYPPPTQRLREVVARALDARASHVHIETYAHTAQVRLRIDGTLQPSRGLPHVEATALLDAVRALAGIDGAMGRGADAGAMQTLVRDGGILVAASLVPTVSGRRAVLRIYDRHRPVTPLDELGMPPDVLRRVHGMLAQPAGMVVVAGPRHSGVTTTLFAAVAAVGARPGGVVTVERPVERIMPGASQIEVAGAGSERFADSLAWAQRQDPDVLVVSELPDPEILAAALRWASSGGLALGGLRAPSAVSALRSMLDLGIEPSLITGSVLGVVAVRLVRRVCRSCRTEGCAACRGTGFGGRTGVYELAEMGDRLRSLVLDRAPEHQLEAAVFGDGRRTLRDHALQLANYGVTTIAEALAATSSPGRR